ncbi:radical SAM/SPASM domain-containing protein [Clostridium sp. FP1]|uniref:radical SAM/SPASM domain-containing protein n=1 Tax=Clostridium sp. FP1 TaxID=2724076 RepID=UPI0013E92D71|nr:radical SAM protein [Clostridium sp. FP1]MBZ9637408.1 radical SAM protein [Clostridium sp. FP1]
MQMLKKKLYFDKDNFITREKGGFCLFFSNKYFLWVKTSMTGQDVLKKLDGEKVLEEVIEEIAEEYMMPQEMIEKDIVNFCETGIENKIIFEEKNQSVDTEFDDRLKFLFIDITNACNLKCIYCNKSSSKDADKVEFIRIETLTEILDKTTPLSKGVDILVNVTGGEPLLHDNLEEIFKLIRSYNCRIVLWTNGILLDEKKADIIKEYCDYIMISVDEFEKEKNDKIRGIGAYDGAVRAAEICTKKSIPFIIVATPTKYNINNLEQILTFAHSIGALGFMLNEPIHIGKNGEDLSEHFDYSLSELKSKQLHLGKRVAIINSWKNNKLKHEKNDKSNIVFVKDTQRCMNNVFSVIPKLSCGAGINELSIDTSGNIYPCHALHIKKYSIGNIQNYPVNKKEFVKTDDVESCGECSYKIFCLGGCRAQSLFHTKKVDGRYPLCEYEKANCEEILWSPLQPIKKK